MALFPLLLIVLLCFAAPRPAAPTRRACAPGCQERGNCNEEEGRCECPWGFTGPSCAEDRMAACKQTPDDPGSCGYLAPKNCECIRACFRLYCSRYGAKDTSRCVSEYGYYLQLARCFLHKPGSGHERQDSWIPPDLANNTIWYSQIPELFESTQYEERMRLQDLHGVASTPLLRPGQQIPHIALPLSECPNNCSNGRGVCIKWSHRPAPECFCHLGYNGTDCGAVFSEEACWFAPDCGGRGECRAGFCHCRPGFWGMGCARSGVGGAGGAGQLAAAGGGLGGAVAGRSSGGAKLRIYMYELPWEVAFPWEMSELAHGRDQIYAANEYFMKYFLQDTSVRTEDPAEATLFFVPALVFFYIGNVRNPSWQMEAVVDHIRTRYPYYNRTGGADHFFFTTGDRGPCHLERWLQDTMIKVVNFGLQRAGVHWVHNQEFGCIQIKRDVVVPPNNPFKDVLPTDTAAYYQWLVHNGGLDANRTGLFTFAGGVGEGTEYSGGTRQAIFRLLNATQPQPSDVNFIRGRTPDYRRLMRTSKFCIAPYGYGWGIRVVQSIQHGCIPIIIQDGVYQAFEDFLPYESFSVRMPLADVPYMIEILRQYGEADLARLRLGMARHHRAFTWDRQYGGLAYEWTLSALQRRLFSLQATHFSRRALRGVGAARGGEGP